MADGSRCYPNEPLILPGRAGTWDESIARNVQLFGSAFGTDGTPTARAIFSQGRQWEIKEPEGRERLWLVETFVREAYRDGEGLNALTASAIVSGTGAASVSQRGVVQVQIDTGNYAGGGRLRMDGGQAIELWGVNLSAQLFLPTDAQEVVDNQSTALSGSPVFDSLFSLSITPIEQTRGKKRCYFTEWQLVGIGLQPLFEVPAFARAVQIRQTGAGVASANWTAEVGGIGAGTFRIPFQAGARQTDIVDLGNVTHLRPDLDPVNVRLYEIVYLMEP